MVAGHRTESHSFDLDVAVLASRIKPMNLPVPLHATGALYNTKSDLRLLSYIEQHADKGIESRGLDVRGWSAIILNSSTPLIQDAPLEGHGYSYYFLFRESGPQRFLLTSTDAKLVDI